MIEIEYGDGEKVLKVIETYDKATYQGLARSLVLVNQIQKKAGRLPGDTLQASIDIGKIRTSYNTRQVKVQNSTIINFGETVKSWSDWVQKNLGISGIGAIPLIPVAIGLTVAGVTAFVVWYYFNSDATTAVKDYETLKPKLGVLESVLADLDEQTAQKVRENVEQVVNLEKRESFNQGRSTDPLNLGSIKTIALVVSGIYVANLLTRNKNYF